LLNLWYLGQVGGDSDESEDELSDEDEEGQPSRAKEKCAYTKPSAIEAVKSVMEKGKLKLCLLLCNSNLA